MPSEEEATAHGDGLVTLPPTPEPTPSSPAPVHIAGYEILGELGRGGMGVVYKARQVRLNRLVAVKMILNAGHASTAELTRFRAEAEAVARLQHPHIVQVYEVGESEGRPFISLEYCAGGGLDRELQRGPFAAVEAAHLVELLARAIQHAHESGIVHRDLKPANILLQKRLSQRRKGAKEEQEELKEKCVTPLSDSSCSSFAPLRLCESHSSHPKITDFGLAKFLDGSSGQTASGAVMGTPSYMAPEQARGKARTVGPAADVYALGAILYELLSGRPPFQGETAFDTLTLVLTQEATPPRRHNPNLPRDLEAICLKCLQKELTHRYLSAADLANDLQRFLAGVPVQAARWTLLGACLHRLRRRVWPLSCAAVALVVALGVLWLTRSQPTVPVPEVDPYAEVRRQEVEREVASLRREVPPCIDSHPPNHTVVAQVESPDNSAFEILEDARVWDLRGWRQVPATQKKERVSAASMTCRLRLKKLRTAREFIQQARTSGLDVFSRCLSHPDGHRVLVSQTATHVGQQQTKTRQCIVDIQNIPLQKEFDLRFVSTFWNSLQTDEDRWVGFIGYPQAFKVSMLLLFPEDRPFRAYQLTVAPTVKADPVPFAGRRIVLADEAHSYLYWEVLHPEPDRVYRIQWEW